MTLVVQVEILNIRKNETLNGFLEVIQTGNRVS
jgi:hypothetical protein